MSRHIILKGSGAKRLLPFGLKKLKEIKAQAGGSSLSRVIRTSRAEIRVDVTPTQERVRIHVADLRGFFCQFLDDSTRMNHCYLLDPEEKRFHHIRTFQTPDDLMHRFNVVITAQVRYFGGHFTLSSLWDTGNHTINTPMAAAVIRRNGIWRLDYGPRFLDPDDVDTFVIEEALTDVGDDFDTWGITDRVQLASLPLTGQTHFSACARRWQGDGEFERTIVVAQAVVEDSNPPQPVDAYQLLFLVRRYSVPADEITAPIAFTHIFAAPDWEPGPAFDFAWRFPWPAAYNNIIRENGVFRFTREHCYYYEVIYDRDEGSPDDEYLVAWQKLVFDFDTLTPVEIGDPQGMVFELPTETGAGLEERMRQFVTKPLVCYLNDPKEKETGYMELVFEEDSPNIEGYRIVIDGSLVGFMPAALFAASTPVTIEEPSQSSRTLDFWRVEEGVYGIYIKVFDSARHRIYRFDGTNFDLVVEGPEPSAPMASDERFDHVAWDERGYLCLGDPDSGANGAVYDMKENALMFTFDQAFAYPSEVDVLTRVQAVGGPFSAYR